MPAQLRPHVAAIYAFARTADDFADEPATTPASGCGCCETGGAKLHDRIGSIETSFVALHDTIDRFALPVQLFDDLLIAFVQDVATTRYSTWADVLDYCRRSANPVGRLVLRLSGYQRRPPRSRLRCGMHRAAADEFLAGPRRSTGRAAGCMCPRKSGAHHHADVASLDAKQMTPEWKAALRDCASADRSAVRTRTTGLRRRVGPAALRAARDLARRHAHSRSPRSVRLRRVQSARPKLGAADALVIAFGTLLWRETRPSPIRS